MKTTISIRERQALSRIRERGKVLVDELTRLEHEAAEILGADLEDPEQDTIVDMVWNGSTLARALELLGVKVSRRVRTTARPGVLR